MTKHYSAIVSAIISKLDTKKSCGLHGIPVVVLQRLLFSPNSKVNVSPLLVFQLIGSSPLWFLFLKTLVNLLTLRIIAILVI